MNYYEAVAAADGDMVDIVVAVVVVVPDTVPSVQDVVSSVRQKDEKEVAATSEHQIGVTFDYRLLSSVLRMSHGVRAAYRIEHRGREQTLIW